MRELNIEEIKLSDDIRLYLHPEYLKGIEGKLFSLGKEEFYTVECSQHSFELKQLYAQNTHIGAKLEIKRK